MANIVFLFPWHIFNGLIYGLYYILVIIDKEKILVKPNLLNTFIIVGYTIPIGDVFPSPLVKYKVHKLVGPKINIVQLLSILTLKKSEVFSREKGLILS